MAAGSLALSVVTFGLSPNFSSVKQAFKGSKKAASEVGQQVAKHGDEAADLARQACKVDGCFPGGTLVSSELGLRPIETIQVGDRVWSLDMIRERWELRPVSKIGGFEYEGGIIRLQIAGEILESTDHHPFWVVEGRDLESRPIPKHAAPREVESGMSGRWVDAVYLQEGDTLQLMSGIRVIISAIDLRATRELVYNFKVDEFHCYAVGEQAVLVHNNDCPLAKSTFELPKTWMSAKGVSGTFSDGKHTFRIDTHNLSQGERFHVHIYDAMGNEIAVIQGAGTNGIWRTTHRGRTLSKPSDVPSELRIDIRRLVRNALNHIE
jgi:hypothetical protein